MEQVARFMGGFLGSGTAVVLYGLLSRRVLRLSPALSCVLAPALQALLTAGTWELRAARALLMAAGGACMAFALAQSAAPRFGVGAWGAAGRTLSRLSAALVVGTSVAAGHRLISPKILGNTSPDSVLAYSLGASFAVLLGWAYWSPKARQSALSDQEARAETPFRISPIRVSSGRAWFLLLGCVALIIWHETRMSQFRQREAAALQEVGVEPGDALDDYAGARLRLDNLRRQPRYDLRWSALKDSVYADAYRDVLRLPVSERDRVAYLRVLADVSAGSLGRKRLMRERGDSLKGEKLEGLIVSGKRTRRDNLALSLAWAIGLLAVAIGYRPSNRRWLTWFGSGTVFRSPARWAGQWWANWEGVWLGLNRAQRSAICLLAIALATTLFLMKLDGLRYGDDSEDSLVWGLVAPGVLAAVALIVVLARPTPAQRP